MLGKLSRKLALLFGRGRYRSELDEEMAFHRAQMEAEMVEDGVPREEAGYASKRRFGNATRLKEQSHEAVGFRFETVAQDLRFAFRQLRHSPGFAISAVLILALGMGASVAIFGFVDAALIEPLPYAAPNQLLDVAENAVAFPRSNLSRADYEDWKRLNRTLSSLDAYTGDGFLLRMGSITEPVPAARVSDGFFRTLGVKPILGRDFLPGEDQPGRAKIVILPYSTWQERFGSRTNVIGQSVSLEWRHIYHSGSSCRVSSTLHREATPSSGYRCSTKTAANSAEAATISTPLAGRARASVSMPCAPISSASPNNLKPSIPVRTKIRAPRCNRSPTLLWAKCALFCLCCWPAQACCC